MRIRSLSLTLLGALAVVAGAELGIRSIEQQLPILSDWPTTETELKSAQLAALGQMPSVLIVGTSVTEGGIDPARLVAMGAAPDAYNAAFPFFSPAATELWLNDTVQPWGDLDLLIVGLPVWPPPEDARTDFLASGLIRAFGSDFVSDPLDNFALWRLRGVLADAGEATQRRKTIAAGLWTDLGHQTFYYEGSGDSLAGLDPRYGRPEMSQTQEGALRRIIQRAVESGATPVILLEPGRFPGEVDDGTIEEYIGWLRALSEELGVVLWDTYSVGWDESLFADETHFNRLGTIEFTEYVGGLMLGLREGS